MDEGLKGLSESHGRLGESYEDGPKLDELDEQLGKSDEDYRRLGESVRVFPNRWMRVNLSSCKGKTRRVAMELQPRAKGTRRVAPVTRRAD